MEPRIWLDNGRHGGGPRLYVQWHDTGPLIEVSEFGEARARLTLPADVRTLANALPELYGVGEGCVCGCSEDSA